MKIKNAKKIDIESLFNTQNTFREYISNKIKNKNNFFKPSLIITTFHFHLDFKKNPRKYDGIYLIYTKKIKKS